MQPAPYADIFVGNGEMAELMRRHDWASTSLGPPERWPEGLKVALRLLLTSRFEMWLGWGPDIAFFYNDAYRPTLGIKHPKSLGAPTRVLWAEIWEALKDRIESVLRDGTATWDRALLLMLERSGYPEETYHTFSYSPLLGDTGKVEGLFCAVSEETERVLSERRLATLSVLASGLATSDTRTKVVRAAEHALAGASRDMPFSLIYLFDDAGVAQLAGAAGIARGHALAPLSLAGSLASRWCADRIAAGEPEVQVSLEDLGVAAPSGPWSIPPRVATVRVLGGLAAQRPLGFMVAAHNPFRPDDANALDFVRLVAGQVGSSFDSADAYEAERRRLAAEVVARTEESDRLRRLFRQAPGFMCVLNGPDFVYELHNDSYQQLVGHRDLAGKTLRVALPELEGQGFFELLQEVRRTGTPFIGRGMRVMLQRVPGAPLEERFVNFVYQPIFGGDGAVDGIFAEGADVTEQFRAERALIELNGTLEVRIDGAPMNSRSRWSNCVLNLPSAKPRKRPCASRRRWRPWAS
jgi:PAS domain-containing protein